MTLVLIGNECGENECNGNDHFYFVYIYIYNDTAIIWRKKCICRCVFGGNIKLQRVDIFLLWTCQRFTVPYMAIGYKKPIMFWFKNANTNSNFERNWCLNSWRLWFDLTYMTNRKKRRLLLFHHFCAHHNRWTKWWYAQRMISSPYWI